MIWNELIGRHLEQEAMSSNYSAYCLLIFVIILAISLDEHLLFY